MTAGCDKVNLAEKLASFDETWTPKIVGALNGQYVKVGKALGAYVWHHHADEDELFMVISGRLRVGVRDGAGGERDVVLEPGEMLVVPRGVEHRPVADEPCAFLLFEPATTRNTGNVDHAYTIEPADLERI